MLIRKRLIELEKKHARAVQKLERAERRRQRRQTFHGFSGQDENTESVTNQNTSSILPCAQAFNSTDVIKTGCLSAHKGGLGKNVSFEETFSKEMCPGNTQWNRSTSSCKTDVKSRSCKKQASKESLKSQSKSGSNGVTMQFEGETDGRNVDSPKKKEIQFTNESLVLQDDERIVDEGANHECEALVFRSNVVEGLSDLSKCEEGIFALANKDVGSVERGSCAKEVDDLSNKNANNKGRRNRNSQDTKNVNLLEDSCTLNKKGNGFQEREPDNVSMLRENASDSSSFENCHWLKLFEEEFPRRSPRFQSTPNFRCRDDTCHISRVTPVSKTKPSKTKRLRAEKEHKKEKIKGTPNIKKNLSVLDGTYGKRSVDDFVFPKPGLELTKPGGPLGIVVDFSLPDDAFVKLKLAKIKSALLVERKKKIVSDGKEMALTPVQESGKICKVTDEKCANKEKNSNIYEQKKQHQTVETVSELPSAKHERWSSNKQNSVPETQDSIFSPADMLGFDDGIKSKDVDMVSSANAAEKVKTAMTEVVPMTATYVQHPRQSFLLQNTTTNDKCTKAHSSPKQKPSEGDSTKKIMPCQAVSDDKCLQSLLKTDDFENAKEISFENETLKEWNKEDEAGNNEASAVNIHLQKTTTSDNVDEEFLNQKESAVGLNFSLDSGDQATSRNVCEEELHRFSINALSPATNHTGPRLGDQVTPHGKMNEPLESSQLPYTCMESAGEPTDGAPVDMTACLQHCVSGECNKVRSVSLSSYEPSTRDTSSLQRKKRDVLAVCLAHLVVIWTQKPDLQWTVMHKWSLPLDGEEEFIRVDFVQGKPHIVLLAGGNFCKGTGRILGYSEEGDYSLDLVSGDEGKKTAFSAMCLLQGNLEPSSLEVEEVAMIIGGRADQKVTMTKWCLDRSCSVVEGCHNFKPLASSDTGLCCLHPVNGSQCLVLGTTVDKLYLWNHKSCQLLRSFILEAMGFYGLLCLKAITLKGFLFLMMASISSKELNCENKNSDACSLHVLNPKTSKVVQLEQFCRSERTSIVGTNGQLIAAVGLRKGEVIMWNINSSHRHATLQAFEDDQVSCVGYHQDMSLVAFGSDNGCVHLFSLN
ncbi:partner and localizer of BRCA2-like isoform X2 [Acropora muricata]|uniref:partner and localizer of BRCA2-like isoform X2 n=1 Tax=Acropora muricata TaxID=159855 RepID=UPI0034E55548